ncbi:MAG: protocatechuate 4,5-dioxygenase subunit alpha [Woeseiaceae bacterium]|jgi:protocatechuate 4,5-dioxygenase alpha chain
MALDKPYTNIPGTTVFDSTKARQGYHLNQFFYSLMKADNRERFREDEKAYLDRFPLSDAQKQAVLDRDYNKVIELGGNVYFFSKLFFTDKKSFELGAASMTGMSPEEYRNMMLSGGRSVEGNRYVEEQG